MPEPRPPLAPAGDAPPSRLSTREEQVLDRARLGLTNAEIGRALGVTVHTVKFHLASAYRKLGAANRTDAIVRWLTAGGAAPAGATKAPREG